MTDRRSRGRVRDARPIHLFASLLVLALAAPLPVPAQTSEETASQPGFVDKRLGEEEQIRNRHEWFFGGRRAGAQSDDELWSLRLAAVEDTRRAIATQRASQALAPEAAQNVWVAKGPAPSTFGGWAFGTVTGRVQALAASWLDGTLYVGATAGGVWKSTNDGLSWTSVFDSAGTLAVGAITVDPNDPTVLWVGTGDNIMGCESYFGIGLLRSPDGGATWELRNGSGGSTLDELASIASIVVDPRDSDRIVTGGKYRGCASGSQQSGGIYTTVDGGASWTNRLSNTEVHEIARDPSVPDILWAATNRGVYKSTDNGVSWIQQSGSGFPSGNLGRTEIAIAPSDPQTVYALFDVPSDQFWRTTDGGATWSLMTADACDGQCWYNMVIRVDPQDPDTIYRGTIRIFKSVNGGSNWTVLTQGWGGNQEVHQDTHSLLMHPTEPGTFYVGSDGGVWKSEDGGDSFVNVNGNLNVTQFYAIDVDANDPDRICGGAQDNSSLATMGNPAWTLQAVTGDGFVCGIDPVDPNYAYITSYPSGGYPNVWRSTSGLFGGFSDVTGPGSGIIGGDRIGWVTPYLLDPVNPNTLYLGTHRVYRSVDHGSSWAQAGPAELTPNILTALEINRASPSVLFAGSSDGLVWRTTDSGSMWTDLSAGLPSRTINDVAADPTNADRAFAVVSGFNTAHVWEWTLATGWVARGAELPNVPANTVLMLSDTDILVGLDTGVFRSVDGGQTFAPFMAGLPEGMVVTDLKYNEAQQIVTAGTYARGAWQVNVGDPLPILLADGVEQPLIQVDGDGDAKVEPGETWSVRPILRNAGGVAAAQVSARLASATPGITVLTSGAASFGDLAAGQATASLTPFEISVDPSYDCGGEMVLDLVELDSATASGVYEDQPGFYSAPVQGLPGPPTVTTLLDEDFDGDPAAWTHQAVSIFGACPGVSYLDEWQLTSKDAAHGQSFHCGNGPGQTYQTDYAWLYPGGKDSEGGAGLTVPANAVAASLTLVHWYDTVAGEDGGQVAVDTAADGQDLFETLKPVGDYPGTLDATGCNLLKGKKAFQGSSGGWITSVFDLTPHKGKQVWLAFVFGSDDHVGVGEGWYVDEVRVDYQLASPPVCDITPWPGEVASASFSLLDASTIEASWDASCNAAEFPGQTFSIQAGDLDVLAAGGGYSHAAVDDRCDRIPTTTFSPGPGNEYYLVLPVGDGREGGAGTDSSGAPRPQISPTCGLRRVSCP